MLRSFIVKVSVLGYFPLRGLEIPWKTLKIMINTLSYQCNTTIL